MGFFLILLLRAVRVLKCFVRSLPKALAASALVMSGASVLMWILRSGETVSYRNCAMMSLTLMLVMWVVVSLADVLSYGMNVHHMYDEDIIGNAFTGIGRKAILFEASLVNFHNEHYETALEGFTAIESEGLSLTEREKGALGFYRGRCYQIMDHLMNAAVCYEKSLEAGFDAPYMPFFLARCYAGTGSTERALEIYSSMIASQHKLSPLVRTETGRMYLELDDPENALKWFNEAIERHENYAEALGGAAVAYTLLNDIKKGEELFRKALLNHISSPDKYMEYFKSVQAAVVLRSGGRNNDD